jgi:ABC-2 type transport system ATP-binding protein
VPVGAGRDPGRVGNDLAVEVRDLRYSYGRFEAVRGLSFDVPRGELFALLGTNGAGKTTAMETIEGHRRATSGHVRVLGLDPVRDRPAVRRRIGMMLQESGFAGDLTVTETIRMWARLRSTPTDPQAALTVVDMDHRADVRVQDLSGGERRRLDFALACLGAPEVLFLDEPTTGLDPESRSRLLTVIADLVGEGTSVVLTTHYLEEAERLAQRIGIMHQGRLQVLGTREEVLDAQPALIRFRLLDSARIGRVLPPLRGREDRTADGAIVVRTSALQHDLTTILSWASAEQLELEGLVAKNASLEDVFASVSRGEGQPGFARATSEAGEALAC